MPSLSILMLVKDEAAWLAPLLPRYLKVADEVVVGDTGSSDGTVTVAKAAGASVVEIPWQEDFAAARNTLLQRATKDWVLVLDADEVVSEANLKAIKANLPRFKAAVGLPIRTYTNQLSTPGFTPIAKRSSEHLDFAGYVDQVQLRLWKRELNLVYAGAILERLEPAPRKAQLITLVAHHYAQEPSRAPKQAAMGSLLETIAKREPKNAPLQFALGLRQRRAGRVQDAIKTWEALSKTPVSGLLAALGEAYLEAGRLDLADDALGEAIGQDPKDVAALSNFGVLCLRQGKAKDAEAYLRRALLADDRNIGAYNLLSLALLQEKKHSALLTHLDIAAKKTRLALFRRQREELQSRLQGAQDRTVARLEAAAHKEPGNVEASVKLAAAHAGLGREGEALAALRRCQEAAPDNVAAHVNLAGMFHHFGRYEDEVKVLEAARTHFKASRSPFYINLLVNLGHAHLALGQRAKAKKAWEDALALKPRAPQVIRKLLAQFRE